MRSRGPIRVRTDTSRAAQNANAARKGAYGPWREKSINGHGPRKCCVSSSSPTALGSHTHRVANRANARATGNLGDPQSFQSVSQQYLRVNADCRNRHQQSAGSGVSQTPARILSLGTSRTGQRVLHRRTQCRRAFATADGARYETTARHCVIADVHPDPTSARRSNREGCERS